MLSFPLYLQWKGLETCSKISRKLEVHRTWSTVVPLKQLQNYYKSWKQPFSFIEPVGTISHFKTSSLAICMFLGSDQGANAYLVKFYTTWDARIWRVFFPGMYLCTILEVFRSLLIVHSLECSLLQLEHGYFSALAPVLWNSCQEGGMEFRLACFWMHCKATLFGFWWRMRLL